MTDKPDILYHGSNKGIAGGRLAPMAQTGNCNGDFEDGERKLVFATHDHSMARLYALKDEHMIGVGNPDIQDGIYSATFEKYEAWKENVDQLPCAVYHLPSEDFTNTISRFTGKPSPEWESKEAVTAVKTARETPETVMQGGGQLFFLDSALGKSIWHDDKTKDPSETFQGRLNAKHAAGTIPNDYNSMQLNQVLTDAGLMTHLNAETGINPKRVEPHPTLERAIADDITWLKEIKQLQELGLGPEHKTALKTAAESLVQAGTSTGKPADDAHSPPPSTRPRETGTTQQRS